MKIVGIDPGWSGGIALFDRNEVNAVGFTGETERDIYDAVKGFIRLADVCYIEKVHSMPKQGVASSFKFGHNYGFLRACVIALGKPLYEVSPAKWQSVLGCMTGGDKNVTKSKAQLLFPKVKVTHAIADAMLIAYYGSLQHKNEQTEVRFT